MPTNRALILLLQKDGYESESSRFPSLCDWDGQFETNEIENMETYGFYIENPLRQREKQQDQKVQITFHYMNNGITRCFFF